MTETSKTNVKKRKLVSLQVEVQKTTKWPEIWEEVMASRKTSKFHKPSSRLTHTSRNHWLWQNRGWELRRRLTKSKVTCSSRCKHRLKYCLTNGRSQRSNWRTEHTRKFNRPQVRHYSNRRQLQCQFQKRSQPPSSHYSVSMSRSSNWSANRGWQLSTITTIITQIWVQHHSATFLNRPPLWCQEHHRRNNLCRFKSTNRQSNNRQRVISGNRNHSWVHSQQVV